MWLVSIAPIYSEKLYMATMFRDLKPDETKSIHQVPSDDIPESVEKMRIHGSDHLRTVLAFFEQETEQHNSKPSNQKLKVMVKRCIDQKVRARNFEARGEGIETGAPAKGRGKPVSVERKQGECSQWKAEGQWTRGDACSFRHDGNKRGTSTRSSSLLHRTGDAKRWENFFGRKFSQRPESVW